MALSRVCIHKSFQSHEERQRFLACCHLSRGRDHKLLPGGQKLLVKARILATRWRQTVAACIHLPWGMLPNSDGMITGDACPTWAADSKVLAYLLGIASVFCVHDALPCIALTCRPSFSEQELLHGQGRLNVGKNSAVLVTFQTISLQKLWCLRRSTRGVSTPWGQTVQMRMPFLARRDERDCARWMRPALEAA